MKSNTRNILCLLLALSVISCVQQTPTTTTSGKLRIEVDESIAHVMNTIADSFQMTYTQAKISVVPVQAREAITDFINDSVRVIVTARELNEEELAVLKKFPEIQWSGYKCALDAVAVIANKDNPVAQLRVSECDSIFNGTQVRWNATGKMIDVAIPGVNSSVNEVFKKKILQGSPFTPAAKKFSSPDSLVAFVEKNLHAIGIVGMNSVRGKEDRLTIFSLGTPGVRPDSTQPYGRFYAPVQANIYRNYYPISRPVYIYSREYGSTLSSGFIGYVNSIHGQQKFLNEGLVPVTMPVRLVQTTSQQVQ